MILYRRGAIIEQSRVRTAVDMYDHEHDMIRLIRVLPSGNSSELPSE